MKLAPLDSGPGGETTPMRVVLTESAAGGAPLGAQASRLHGSDLQTEIGTMQARRLRSQEHPMLSSPTLPLSAPQSGPVRCRCEGRRDDHASPAGCEGSRTSWRVAASPGG